MEGGKQQGWIINFSGSIWDGLDDGSVWRCFLAVFIPIQSHFRLWRFRQEWFPDQDILKKEKTRPAIKPIIFLVNEVLSNFQHGSLFDSNHRGEKKNFLKKFGMMTFSPERKKTQKYLGFLFLHCDYGESDSVVARGSATAYLGVNKPTWNGTQPLKPRKRGAAVEMPGDAVQPAHVDGDQLTCQCDGEVPVVAGVDGTNVARKALLFVQPTESIRRPAIFASSICVWRNKSKNFWVKNILSGSGQKIRARNPSNDGHCLKPDVVESLGENYCLW